MNARPQSGLGVIILGAGASVRMGRPKLLLPWQGTTVIGQIISTWHEVGATQIGLVMRAGDGMLAAELDRLGFPADQRIENLQPEEGMFSSIRCAAIWAGWQKQISAWAIVLGDQPHLSKKALQQLVAFHAEKRCDICQPTVNGHGGHPVILSKPAFEELKQTRAETLKDFLKLMAGSCVQLQMDDPGVLLDLDTPEDYIRLKTVDP